MLLQFTWCPIALQIFIILLYFIGGLRVTGAGYFFANWANIVLVSFGGGPQLQH